MIEKAAWRPVRERILTRASPELAARTRTREESRRSREKVLTVLLDLAGAAVAGGGAGWAWAGLLGRELSPWHALVLVVLGAFWVLGLLRSRSLSDSLRRSILDDLPAILTHVLRGSMVVVLGSVLASLEPDSGGLIVVAAGLGVVFMPVARGSAYALLNRRNGCARQRVLVVGTGKIGRGVARILSGSPQVKVQLVGFLDEDPTARSRQGFVEDWPLLGNGRDLARILEEGMVNEVILAFPDASHQEGLEMIWECDRHGVNVSTVPQFFETMPVRSTVENVGGMPLMHLSRVRLKGFDAALKRAFDVTLTVLGLIVIWPLLIGIALAVKLDSPGPVVFSQQRVGRDGTVFTMHKFRSMRTDSELVSTWTVREDPRRTRVGRFLRATSLDELPQLWNVLRGEMSLVGPRPEQPRYARRFAEEIYRYDHRHRATSGITGWAQVNGLRGDVPLEEVTVFDNYYIENWSLWLDVKILVLTFVKGWISQAERPSGPR